MFCYASTIKKIMLAMLAMLAILAMQVLLKKSFYST